MKILSTLNKIHLTGVAIALCTGATGQKWVTQAPLPTANHLNTCFMTDSQNIFVGGFNGTLLFSSDGGATWKTAYQGLDGSDAFYQISFSTPLNGVALSSDNQNLRTTNGGLTWTAIEGLTAQFREMEWVSPTVGFGGCGGAMFKTTDGGASFTLKSGDPTCPYIWGMDFKDGNVGIVGGGIQGGSNGMFKTTNGGVTWTRKYTGDCNTILYMSGTEWLSIDRAVVIRSTNDGESWSQIGTCETGLGQMVKVGNSGRLAGVSVYGTVSISDNGGVSWTTTLNPIGNFGVGEWDIHFGDNLNGVVSGQGGTIYLTHDGGLTWQRITSGFATGIKDLKMYDANLGVAVGDFGYIMQTTNGGRFWNVMKPEHLGNTFTRGDLNCVSNFGRNSWFAAGQSGVAYRSNDAGATWFSIGFPNLPGDLEINSIKFTSELDGWVAGINLSDLHRREAIYQTHDGGFSWELNDQGPIGWAALEVKSPYAWLTDGYDIIRSTNDFQTFTFQTLPNLGIGTLSDLKFWNANEGWAVGPYGTAYHTYNGGTTWTKISISTLYDGFFRVTPTAPGEAVAIAMLADPNTNHYGPVLYTFTNGGATVKRAFLFESYNGFTAIGATSIGNVWVAGDQGRIDRKFSLTRTPPRLN